MTEGVDVSPDDMQPSVPFCHSVLGRALCRSSKCQLLNTPIGGFSSIHLCFRRAGQLMNPGELLELAAGAANDAKDLAVERNFEQPSGIGCFADKQYLVRSR